MVKKLKKNVKKKLSRKLIKNKKTVKKESKKCSVDWKWVKKERKIKLVGGMIYPREWNSQQQIQDEEEPIEIFEIRPGCFETCFETIRDSSWKDKEIG